MFWLLSFIEFKNHIDCSFAMETQMQECQINEKKFAEQFKKKQTPPNLVQKTNIAQ